MAAVVLLSCQLQAHPADISRLRVKLERQRVELRFTFNLLVLSRFYPGIDRNQDGRVDAEELKAAREGIARYLNRQVQMKVNGGKAELGGIKAVEAMWPSVEGVIPAVQAADYPARHVEILFVRQDIPLLADLWLGFDIWREAGPLGSVEAVYEQGDLCTQVPFSLGEPDYLYDTGFAVEGVFQEPAPPSAPVMLAESLPVDWKLYAAGALIAFVLLPLLLFLSSRPKKP
ncbi:MAG: hypothetical protein CJBNEKGG_03685 [Prosthecobacter sp.]|nr:hypothetical protein [Prosthecobacter sp.]